MTDYQMACPDCSHDVSAHEARAHFGERGYRGVCHCGCVRTRLDLYAAECVRLAAECAKMLDAINWACGCAKDFNVPDDSNKRRYWWRNELHDRAGLIYDPSLGKYTIARTALDAKETHNG